MQQKSNYILIAGTGRNVGKTTLACRLIKQLAATGKVTAVKIAPHFHELTKRQIVIHQEEGLTIVHETDEATDKDTSRYLRAGAWPAIYVQAVNKKLPALIGWMEKKLDTNFPVIIESGGLGKYIHPGKAYFVEGKSTEKQPKWNFEYECINLPLTP